MEYLRRIQGYTGIFFVLFIGAAYGSKATIDADGGAQYVSLDVALTAFESSSAYPDTVQFIGNDQDTYTMSVEINKLTNKTIVFLGTATNNPDSFPIINRTTSAQHNLFLTNRVTFEKLIFTGSAQFERRNPTSQLIFRRCVIRNYTSGSFIQIHSGDTLRSVFENCLFVNNTSTNGIFDVNFWGKHHFRIINCTFDRNTKLFTSILSNDYEQNFIITNCIFSDNNSTFSDARIKAKTTNSLTSESSISGYGTGCVMGSASYSVGTTRTKPSDWMLVSTSAAKGIGTAVNAPIIDIAGRTKISRDAGCWGVEIVTVPKITKQPDSLRIGEGKVAAFTITASGSNLKFAWFKTGFTTDTLSKDSTLVFPADTSKNGSLYYCVVSNELGSETSRTVLLKVLKKPVITKNLNDTSVVLGTRLLLRLQATGSELSFQWYRNGVALTEQKTDSLVINQIDTSYDKDTVYCTVSNSDTSVLSVKAVLTVIVNNPAVITAEPDSFTNVYTGVGITLSLIAAGTEPITYTWYKNGLTDSVGNDRIFSKVSALLGDSGVYRCIVVNSYGSDTSRAVTVSVTDPPEATNPIRLAGTFVNKSHVRMRISDFKTLPTVTSARYVDTIGIWYGSDKNVLTPDIQSVNRIMIPFALFPVNADYFDTLVTVQSGGDSCFSYSFLATTFWKNPMAVPPFDTAAGATVLMCDTNPILNNLVLACTTFQNTDSVRVIISGLSSLDKSKSGSLVVSYGSQLVPYTRDTIAVAAIGEGDLYSKVYRDNLFLGDQTTITFSVKIVGISGNSSSEKTTDVMVGIKRPLNNVTLSVNKIHPDKIDLAWTLPDTEKVDSLRLWYGKEPTPLSFNPDTSKFKTIGLDATTRAVTVSELDPYTQYYFAIQVKNGALWSYITAVSRISARTQLSSDTTRIPNSITAKEYTFNSQKNTITVKWTIDTVQLGTGPFEAGISWAMDAFPDTVAAANPQKVITSEVIQFSGKENSTELYLGNNQLFDTLYFFSMVMRRTNALWSYPSERARGTLKIPAPQWQEITYFDKTDSAYSLNNSFIVRKGASYPQSASILYKDTIEYVSSLSVSNSFIALSRPFKFRFASNTPSIEWGYRYDSIPAGYSHNDIYMYEYVNGKWFVLDRITVDPTSRMVFTALSGVYSDKEHRKNPHLLMIDKINPVVTIGDTASVLDAARDFIVRLSVSDNVANVSYKVKCAPIDKPLNVIFRDTADDVSYYKSITISHLAAGLSVANSLKMIIIVTDGAHTDTFDISRQVRRSTEMATSRAMQWVPVSTTTDLDAPGVENALINLCNTNVWAYDSTRFRLFYWDPFKRNGENSYVQYSPDRQDLFKMIPGRVFWVKSRVQRPIQFGAGKTVSILQPFNVALQPKQWTDVVLPFDISLYVADMFEYSRSITANDKDSVWIYSFDAVNTDGVLTCSPVYNPMIPDYQSKLAILKNEPQHSYTIYNASGKEINLVIPPLDTSNSLQKKTVTKKLQEKGWYLTVTAQADDDIIPPVLCGFTTTGTGVSKFPSPPAPGSVLVNIRDTSDVCTYGTVIYHEERHGYSYPLIFSNRSGSVRKTITYSIHTDMLQKSGLDAVVYSTDNFYGKTGLSDLSVSLAPGERAYRWVLVGDTTYFAQWVKGFSTTPFALTGVRPLAGNSIRVSLSVPYSGITSLKLSIVNQLGQVVASQMARDVLPGTHELFCPVNTRGKLASGSYIIQLSGFDTRMKLTRTLHRKFLYISN